MRVLLQNKLQSFFSFLDKKTFYLDKWINDRFTWSKGKYIRLNVKPCKTGAVFLKIPSQALC